VRVLAVETFLADIAQNVAGDRLKVEALAPYGADPHEFEPSPQDMVKLADSQVIIVNGGGVEGWLQKAIETVGGQHQVITASDGLTSRTPREGEAVELGGAAQGGTVDPHFWLDPVSVQRYVENIRDGLSQADPAGKDTYAQHAAAYVARLKDLDGWIRQQVTQIPEQRRLLITNHESLGYFADRYGLRIVGTIIPSTSSEASPSAQQLARLVDVIKSTGAPAIFLETGTNPQLAQQVSQETGVKVVTDLYTHSITAPGGAAPTYIDMMKYNTLAIVNALK
jgi:ABC-type Zn uptake system ZnuABC Zn-binding protein ZnuA